MSCRDVCRRVLIFSLKSADIINRGKADTVDVHMNMVGHKMPIRAMDGACKLPRHNENRCITKFSLENSHLETRHHHPA